jgi:ATP-dependent helicase HrpA
MLYGLPIVNRTVAYDRVDKSAAREMFIRCALVEGDWTTHQKFWPRNQQFLRDLAGISERMRRPELVDPEAVYAFYARRLSDDIVSTRHFDRWWKDARTADPELLTMKMEHFVGASGALSANDFPGSWQQGEFGLALTYRFDPGASDDGVTVHVPVTALNQITSDGLDWQVPGFREDLVEALMRSLPKKHRRELVPMADVIGTVTTALQYDEEPITAALARTVREAIGVSVPARAFDWTKVPAHLRVTYSIDHEQGRSLAMGKDLEALRAQLAPQVRAAIARSAPIEERKGITEWDFGDLPTLVESPRDGMVVRGYPALLDDGRSVSIRVLTNAELQAKVMRTGVRRLLLLAVPVSKRAIERDLDNQSKLAVARAAVTSLEDLELDCLTAAADKVLVDHGGPSWTADGFAALVHAARNELADQAARALKLATDILAAANGVHSRLDRLVAPAVQPSADDVRQQLSRLVRADFVAGTGLHRLADVLRYVRAIEVRLTKLPESPLKDQAHLRDVLALEGRYIQLLRRTPRDAVTPAMVDLGWMLEELRVSVFAQSLGAAKGTSPARIVKALQSFGA